MSFTHSVPARSCSSRAKPAHSVCRRWRAPRNLVRVGALCRHRRRLCGYLSPLILPRCRRRRVARRRCAFQRVLFARTPLHTLLTWPHRPCLTAAVGRHTAQGASCVAWIRGAAGPAAASAFLIAAHRLLPRWLTIHDIWRRGLLGARHRSLPARHIRGVMEAHPLFDVAFTGT